MKPIIKQRGFALLVFVALLTTAAATATIKALNNNSSNNQIARDKITAAALAQAKDALIGYAAAVQLSSSQVANQKRPGDMPCPDLHVPGSILEGTFSFPCSGNAIGRLPWKTLGLTDLRDSSGERLWYAVSVNFKNNPRTPTLNSDTLGTISVFAPDGTLINDGGGSSGAVAVIIAPGDVLQRQGGTLQDRSNVGNNTASNYLDIATVGGNTEDNANFTDGSSIVGFIQGRIKDGSGNVILNDQLLVITQDNIMQAIQKRVASN